MADKKDFEKVTKVSNIKTNDTPDNQTKNLDFLEFKDRILTTLSNYSLQELMNTLEEFDKQLKKDEKQLTEKAVELGIPIDPNSSIDDLSLDIREKIFFEISYDSVFLKTMGVNNILVRLRAGDTSKNFSKQGIIKKYIASQYLKYFFSMQDKDIKDKD